MTSSGPATKRRALRAVITAFATVTIAAAASYALTGRINPRPQPNPPPAPATGSLEKLQAHPTLGARGPRYDILVDLECPYCNQFLSSRAYAAILALAHADHAQLNVTAVAFLNERSVIKAAAYNCVASLAGPAAALQLLPDLKTPGGDTSAWNARAPALAAQYAPENDLRACIADGGVQERANDAFKATGARGVPAVFVDGVETPWTELDPADHQGRP